MNVYFIYFREKYRKANRCRKLAQAACSVWPLLGWWIIQNCHLVYLLLHKTIQYSFTRKVNVRELQNIKFFLTFLLLITLFQSFSMSFASFNILITNKILPRLIYNVISTLVSVRNTLCWINNLSWSLKVSTLSFAPKYLGYIWFFFNFMSKAWYM